MRKLRKFLLLIILIGLASLAYMYSVAVRDPLIRTANIAMPDWPAETPPVKVMLVADVHIAGPDMPPERIARIVGQINEARPDIVMFAGDFVSDKRTATRHYPASALTKPLSKLSAPLGVIAAVPGNHDHWRGLNEVRDALEAAGLTVLANQAVRVGPIIVGGVDDEFTDHDDVGATLTAMEQVGGDKGPTLGRVILSHGPDIMPDIPAEGAQGFVPLILAGHTHCGQITLPFIGALSYLSRYGDRYSCGIIREDGKTLVVTAGIGTSILPLRLGAVPDMWLLTLGPES